MNHYDMTIRILRLILTAAVAIVVGVCIVMLFWCWCMDWRAGLFFTLPILLILYIVVTALVAAWRIIS